MKEYTKNRESQAYTVESNSNGFRQPPVSKILQAYRNGTLGRSPIQRESIEEDDDLTSGQPPVSTILQQYSEKRQKYASEEDEEMLQGKFDTAQRQEKTNNTGLPDNLKSGIESLSGYSMDDVKVHYNSDKPAQLNALAYAQGTDIHVTPGQEKHLPHEAWHVVQQKQGRVQPTMQLQGVNVNDNEELEKEANNAKQQSQTYVKKIYQFDKIGNTIQRLGHPLANDESETNVDILDFLHRFDSKGTIRNLLLEDTWAAKLAMETYKTGRKKADADVMLFKSILATIELHKSGVAFNLVTGNNVKLTEEEEAILKIATLPYESKEWLVQQYELDEKEVKSIEAYSFPNKSDISSDYYMGESETWKPYKDGWDALSSALKKIPNLGQLGLEITTYRAPRGKTESDKLGSLACETIIKHGSHIMDMGQKHYTSTALSYNSHWLRTNKVGGLMAFTGKSGVFINPFGGQGFVDGGEILYPPEFMSMYEGQNLSGYSDRETKSTYPVFHLKEVEKQEKQQAVVDDFKFDFLHQRDPELDRKKIELISAIEIMVDKHGVDVLKSARIAKGIKGPIMYLTIDDLEVLYERVKYYAGMNEIMKLFD